MDYESNLKTSPSSKVCTACGKIIFGKYFQGQSGQTQWHQGLIFCFFLKNIIN